MATSHAQDWIEPAPSGLHAEESAKLALVREFGQALADTRDFKEALTRALQLLSQRDAALTGAIALVRGEHGRDIEYEVGVGTQARGRVRGAEPDAIERVLQSGRPAVVLRERREASGTRQRPAVTGAFGPEVTHVVAPVMLDQRVAGALAIDLLFDPERDVDRAAKYVAVYAAMVAQALAAQRQLAAARLADDRTVRSDAPAGSDFANLVGTSAPLGQVRAQVAQVAAGGTTVLLRGESGTGKGLIAHAIHLNSPRAKRPFVTVSCAALPPDLLESELFGYEPGAFTGAHGEKKGRFELANGGTLFLDEIGELSPAIQVKLLRVLQERTIERLGGTRSIKLDIRLVAATHKDLEKSIAAGEFREDLYYRLNVFTIFVPPLRDRKADVLLLADHFLEKFAREHGKSIRRITTPAIDMLASYHWPGNVRELANAIERAVVVCDSNAIHSHHLPPTLQTAESSGSSINLSLREQVEAVERDALQDALKTARGNRATAARLLRTTRRIFNYKVRRYGIDWRRFR